MNKPTLYKVYYGGADGEFVAYLGRTKNNLTQRLRHHFFKHPFQRTLDVDAVLRIEYAEFVTVADMFVAEIVLINQLKPPLNVDDKAPDELTLSVDVSHVHWIPWTKTHLLEKWSKELRGKR